MVSKGMENRMGWNMVECCGMGCTVMQQLERELLEGNGAFFDGMEHNRWNGVECCRMNWNRV